MGESVYYSYVPYKPVKAGQARAKNARRDKFGRFLPNYGDLPIPIKHGQAGGLARITRCKRDARGRFIKA